MEVDYVDRENRSIRVYSSKTDDWRTVYFRESSSFLLDQWLDGGYRDSYVPASQSPYLFPGTQSDQIPTATAEKVVLRRPSERGCKRKCIQMLEGNQSGELLLTQ